MQDRTGPKQPTQPTQPTQSAKPKQPMQRAQKYDVPVQSPDSAVETSTAKMVTFALAALVCGALTAATVASMAKPELPDVASASPPLPSMIDECNRYAAQVARDGGADRGDAIADADRHLVGLHAEHRDSPVARGAYRDCMLGIQRAS